MLGDPNEPLRENLIAALKTKKKADIEKAVKNFENQADPNFVKKEDKDLIGRIKRLISNKDYKDSMFIDIRKILFL